MPTSPIILDDDAALGALTPRLALDAMAEALLEHGEGALVAPPKFHVATERGRLTYTAGASSERFKVNGFRVYSVYPESTLDTDASQVVAVFDDVTGALSGLCVGRAVGVWRTAGINGVAIDRLARQDAQTLGVLGAGNHAQTHTTVALATRAFQTVLIHNRTPARAHAFAERLRAEHPALAVEVRASAEAVARAADVLICATSSPTPLFDAACLRPGTHVNTIGPKFIGRHELDPNVAARAALICTDCTAQVAAYGPRFFLHGTEAAARIQGLGAWMQTGTPRDPDAITLFCSVGLAGTEVCLAATLLEHAAGS